MEFSFSALFEKLNCELTSAKQDHPLEYATGNAIADKNLKEFPKNLML